MSRFITATLDGIEITRAKDVKKHGDHDQSSHGAWATGTVVDFEKKPIPKNELQRDVDKGEKISAQIKLGDKSLKVTQKNEKYPDGTVVMNLYVTDKDDNKVGYLGASTQFNDNKFATITNVKVRSEYRRQGVATAMLNFARSHMMDGLEIKHDTNRLSPEGEAWSRVTKHGDHDQSSHGNWAHGIEVAPEVVR